MKILFVCTGNICRSPMAEGILRHKLHDARLSDEADSCGFESFHVGDHPDKRAQDVCRNYGLDISSHVARLFRKSDFDTYDHIYVMDSSHYYKVSRIARSAGDMKKVDYVLNLLYPGQDRQVDDPWYHGMEAFEKAYTQLDSACEKLVNLLRSSKNEKP